MAGLGLQYLKLPDCGLALYRQMILMRRFDEVAIELLAGGRIEGVVHPYSGQEAIAAGVCAHLTTDDRITSTHRGHGHCIAKGARTDLMMAELFGRRTGYCKGKGGSMHIAAFEVGMLGANGIVGSGLAIAAGSALAARLRGSTNVVICFFGDGAVGAGAFHETMNISAIWKLPVVWVCENNGWATNTPVEAVLAAQDVVSFASAYGLPSEVVDGNNLTMVYEAAGRAVERARSGGGPTLLEAKTFRRSAHALRAVPHPDLRDAALIAEGKARDPIPAFARLLREAGVLTEDLDSEILHDVERELARAIEFAEQSPEPAPYEALDDVFAG